MVGEDPVEALAVLGRKYTLDILEATEEPCSARELQEELDIPMATCHRRLEDLCDLGFLDAEKQTRERDKRNRMVYTRSVDHIKFDFENAASMETRQIIENPPIQ